MLLDSPIFLYYFLPIVLAVFYLSPPGARGLVLLGASAVYFALADAAGLPVLAAAILGNYLLGRLIGRGQGKARECLTAVGVAANLGLLAGYKYGGGASPLGISFFTFGAIAYLIDVSRGGLAPERSLSRFAAAMAFFPKITAGPIARFGPLFPELVRPRPTFEDVRQGAWRVAVGLAKKTLVAGTLAPLADAAFGRSSGLDMGTAWLGLACYTAQIYYDFSGYTDMAVGLGRLFGVHLPENFEHPYVSRSVREFWRRWHISLSSWFRDYLYIPLGGGRCAPWRVQANLLIVFALCGVWHGATLNFLIWGLWHGVFLSLERTAFGRWLDARPAALRHAYLLLSVMLGWVLFRATDFAVSARYFSALFSFSTEGFAYTWMVDATRQRLTALAVAVLFAMPLDRLWTGVCGRFGDRAASVAATGQLVAMAGLLAASAMIMAAGGYAPFIYARF
ncbi:MBOAT family O-acyltransferase [Desulfovibrio sp. TomC]|uniref:MBOAT family O-acyltransferase n=1 Tax=Desulfovibrio sp. TomC TaxID=1562888 RepID=UPI0005733C85|nr:MBOAT family O-acyltransferase [Desulfovibrio sp. TomC]KHK01282.1 putative poly(beta-D-mannuronate) O-acetylase [Desulfovibrio sp. TomC]